MIAVAVPFYVDRPVGEPRRPDDAPFDHPTPLGGAPTLPRLLDSLERLAGQPFELVVVVGWVHPELAPAAEDWARALLAEWRPPTGVGVHLLGTWDGTGIPDDELLDPTTYSGIRNRCLAAAVALDADALVLLDDDEAVRDRALLDELCGPLGEGLDGNAGLYMEGGERVVVPVPPTAASAHFDANGPRLAAFEQVLAAGRPLDAPFAFGGNLALSSRLIRRLPFDPLVPRGEDVDYVLSARLHGHRVRLDPTLLVDHHAPPRRLEPWRQLWIDGWRFLAQRRKLACALEAGCPPLELDPYPGQVLTADLGERLARALTALDAPAASVDALAAWEDELAGLDPWAEYRGRATTWRPWIETLRDPGGWLQPVEGR